MRHAIGSVVRFGNITREARIIIWLLMIGFVLELLKLLARHG
jgi:hypothetical protein